MINWTALLCGKATGGDRLRYSEDSSINKEPAIVVYNSTKRCNLRCLHCYADAKESETTGELSTIEAKALIDDLIKIRLPVLLFSGGEPLLRKDLFELGKYATEGGVRTVISTNGTLITKEIAQRIKNAGFQYVGVSLDGARKTNDRFRRISGAFDKALQGIRNCQDVGIGTGLRFTITKRNFKDLPKIFELLINEKIPRLCIYHLVYAGRGINLIDEDLWRPQRREFLNYLYEKTLQLRDKDIEILTVDNHSDGPYLYLKLLQDNPQRAEVVMQLLKINGGNRTGVGIACVDAKGFVHPNQFWRHYSFGNVKERPFSQIWKDSSDALMSKLKNKSEFVKGRCRRCRFLKICAGGSRVRAEFNFGDEWQEDPACSLTDEEIL